MHPAGLECEWGLEFGCDSRPASWESKTKSTAAFGYSPVEFGCVWGSSSGLLCLNSDAIAGFEFGCALSNSGASRFWSLDLDDIQVLIRMSLHVDLEFDLVAQIP